MTLPILLKVLDSLSSITQLTPTALELKQTLEMFARDPAAANQINAIIAQPICTDWDTYTQAVGFLSRCITQGDTNRIPLATQHFTRIATENC